jgi:hypothetical protein
MPIADLSFDVHLLQRRVEDGDQGEGRSAMGMTFSPLHISLNCVMQA